MTQYNPTLIENRAFADHMVKRDDYLDDALEWIREHLAPDEVFSEDKLEQWAEGNGYVEAEEETE